MGKRMSVWNIASSPIIRLLAVAASLVMPSVVLMPCGYAGPAVAPDFKINECINADSLMLSEFVEYPVVLFFFDAGDLTCFRTYPYVVNWHAKYSVDELNVIGIHGPRYEPMRSWHSVITAIARTELAFPIALDYDRKTFADYSIEVVPTLVLLEPGGRIVSRTSEETGYRDFEEDIQRILREIEPGVVLPFLYDRSKIEGKTGKYPPPTPKIELGYGSGLIANCDSTGFDSYGRYADPGDRDKGKVYLDGRWKVGDRVLTYEEGEAAHIRVIYSGKDVWLLPNFDQEHPVRIYVEQDRSPLPNEIWGRDIMTDISTRTFLNTRYPIPLHVVSNTAYGTHELKIIPEEGTVSFHYLFFLGTR